MNMSGLINNARGAVSILWTLPSLTLSLVYISRRLFNYVSSRMGEGGAAGDLKERRLIELAFHFDACVIK